MLPNFIIGGTSAGGTSFLSAAMIQHPDIYLPVEMRPEPHYYYKSWEYKKGLDYYQNRWFTDVKGEKAIGERSSSYMFAGDTVAARMKKDMPDLKLIFTLRDPVQRAWANYRYTALQGVEDTDFESALRHEPERIASQQGIWAEIQPFNYTGRGFYGRQLQQFLTHFPRDQILLIESEQMNKDPQRTFNDVFEFLGVDLDFQPELPPLHSSLNVHCPKEQKAIRQFFGDKFDLLIESIRKHQDPSQYVSNKDEKANLQRLINNLDDKKHAMSDWSIAHLTSLYKEDVAILKSQLHFFPQHWN